MTTGFRQSLSVTQCAERARSRGVSPVIGVILLVAITVVLVASIGVVFFSLSDLQDAPPQAAFDTEVDEAQGEALLTVQRGEQIEREALTATGGTIVEAPEVLRAGSTVLIDLEEDAEQLQLIHQQGDQSTILTETDRKPFINTTVSANPPVPGVSVAAERAETGDIVAEGQTDENGIVRLPVDDPEQEYEIVVQFDEPVTSGEEEITAVEEVETTTPDELEITTEDIAGADENLTRPDVEELFDVEIEDEQFPNNPFLEDAQTDNGGLFANLGGDEVVALEEGTKMSEFPTADSSEYDGQFMQPVYANTANESISIEVDSIDFGPKFQELGVDPYNEKEFGETDQWYRIPTGIGTPYPISGTETAWDEDGNFEGEPIAGDRDGDYELVEITETDDGFKVVWEYLDQD